MKYGRHYHSHLQNIEDEWIICDLLHLFDPHQFMWIKKRKRSMLPFFMADEGLRPLTVQPFSTCMKLESCFNIREMLVIQEDARHNDKKEATDKWQIHFLLNGKSQAMQKQEKGEMTNAVINILKLIKIRGIIRYSGCPKSTQLRNLIKQDKNNATFVHQKINISNC